MSWLAERLSGSRPSVLACVRATSSPCGVRHHDEASSSQRTTTPSRTAEYQRPFSWSMSGTVTPGQWSAVRVARPDVIG